MLALFSCSSRISLSLSLHSGRILIALVSFGSFVSGLLHCRREFHKFQYIQSEMRQHANTLDGTFGILTKSMVLAAGLLASLHQVSHHSHSWGRDLMGTWWIMLLGRSWSRLAKELGSWERAWYCPHSRSPAASRRNLSKSSTYRAEMW